MFVGEYRTKFTGQGRRVLPKKFRSVLKGKTAIILSRGFEGCIWGFAPAEWEIQAVKQLEQSITEKEARDLRRYLFSAAENVSLDDQGRFIINNVLLEHAHLDDEVVLVGAGDHFEVWNPSDWQKLMTKLISKA